MLSLQQSVKIRSVNCRAELHGDKHVPAIDIGVEVNVSNDMLGEFHPTLKSFLFEKDANPEQSELALDENRLTKLRMPQIGSLKWGWEGEGYRLFVAYGITRQSGVMMADCKVDGFVIEPKEGGTCTIRFRAAAHPREDDIGKLVSLIQSEAEIELGPPTPDQQADMLIAKTKKKAAEGVSIE